MNVILTKQKQVETTDILFESKQRKAFLSLLVPYTGFLLSATVPRFFRFTLALPGLDAADHVTVLALTTRIL